MNTVQHSHCYFCTFGPYFIINSNFVGKRSWCRMTEFRTFFPLLSMFPSYRLPYFIFAGGNSVFKRYVNRQKLIFFRKCKATDVCVNYLAKRLVEAKSDVLLFIPVYHGHDL